MYVRLHACATPMNREDNLQRQIDATRASIQRGRSYQHTTPSSSISRTYIPPSSRFPANDSSTSPPVRPITCYLTDRFVDVLDLMIRHDTRRIFVLHSEVDPRPVDVISHSDVLRIITEKLLRKR